MFNYLRAEMVGLVYGCANKAGEITSNREVMDRAYQLGGQVGSGEACDIWLQPLP